MAGIFISYRREDARGDAGRLTNDLRQYLGPTITKAVGSCGVLLAVIGPHWLTITDKKGRRRLEDSCDYVRLEILAALNRNIRVIPVLVGGAAMPATEDLPAELQKLALHQAYELSDRRWDFDVRQLITALERIPGIVKNIMA